MTSQIALDEARVGQLVGPYRLIQLLGSGGMGVVYLAERSTEEFAQLVALKLMRDAPDAKTRERFEQERQILAGLRHPAIAALFDGGRTADGQVFYTMECIEGDAINDYCSERLDSIEKRVLLLLQVASALAHAHQHLVIHSDIKPSNILVTRDGHAKLVDFGLAKHLDPSSTSMASRVAGPMTPLYAAPEQFRNGQLTVATDIYQFGVLCFVCLTGRLPYSVSTHDSLAWARATTESEVISLTRALAADTSIVDRRRRAGRDLDAVVRKAMAKAPGDRYSSMDAMIADLKAFLNRQPVRARSAGMAYFASRFFLRHPRAITMLAATFVALAAAAGFAVRGAQTAAREADRATAVAGFLVDLFQVDDPGPDRGERLTANEILDRGAVRIGRELAGHPEQHARLLTVLGKVFQSLGDFSRSKPLLDEAVRQFRSLPNAERADYSDALQALALWNARHNDWKPALALLDEEMKLYPGASAEDFEGVARALVVRGGVLNLQGDMAAARSDYERARELLRRAGDRDRMLIARIEMNINLFLQDMDDYAGAKRALDEACNIYRASLPASDIHVVDCGISEGFIFLQLGDFDRAQQLLERGMADTRQRYGENSHKMATLENNLGYVAWKQHRYEDALRYFAAAERAYGAALGEASLQRSWPIMFSGFVLTDMGDHAGALHAAQKALAIRSAQLPADHPTMATTFDMMARVLWRQGRYREAHEYAAKCLPVLRAKMPPDHSSVVDCLYDLGMTEYAMGDRESATQHLNEALERAERVYGPSSSELADIRRAASDPDAVLRGTGFAH